MQREAESLVECSCEGKAPFGHAVCLQKDGRCQLLRGGWGVGGRRGRKVGSPFDQPLSDTAMRTITSPGIVAWCEENRNRILEMRGGEGVGGSDVEK